MALTLWALSDESAGNRRQAGALAAACGGHVETLVLQPRRPWRWAAPRRLPGAAAAFGTAFADRLRGPLPALAIGCGRQAALATRLLRAAGCPVVQILDPRLDPRHWDLVLVPAHDRLRGDNVLVSLGSLHPVDDRWLERARHDWPALGRLPSPRITLLLGGPTAAAPFSRHDFERLAATVTGWQRAEGGSLLVSSSRRTPDWLRAAARERFASLPGVQWHGPEDGPNPYPGLLGWADRLVVGADSANLLSEACAVGVPVLAPLPERPRGRIAALHRALLQRELLRPLQPRFEPWTPTPLRETAALAAAVRARLGLA
jgi:uncharacterized protein